MTHELNQRLEALVTKREGNQTDHKFKKNTAIFGNKTQP